MTETTDKEPQGCLAVLLKLIGIDLTSTPPQQKLPYRLRDDFLSPAELSFFRVLQQSVSEELVICPKVRLADLFLVPGAKEGQSYRNKIDRKHVDFLLCSPDRMTPQLAIELDDASHSRKQRQARDQFVDSVFAAAGLPLLHIPASRTYSVLEIAEQVHLKLAQTSSQPTKPKVHNGTPVCPRCDVEMVLRTAAKGARQGEQFWGCQNYPQCRETVPV